MDELRFTLKGAALTATHYNPNEAWVMHYAKHENGFWYYYNPTKNIWVYSMEQNGVFCPPTSKLKEIEF
ncbi:hypothetical protein PMW_176 [Pseudomonas phage phiPMW]|uniref:Uncharacterized protein n=1 Tax=Pseudomonas phage phiPMW TaxID=1815582 RepID=A0A1S5R1M1_9CAUD|nr:hypothetical protein FDG97_gp174 [Pseudomonas phage phiPMW]ANA49301.1 hypothetical protein PMW_176 [Pseudomonas phage phiPMW]